MKILFVENREKTLFWEQVALDLQRRGCKVMWLVQNPTFSPKQFSKPSDIFILPYPPVGMRELSGDVEAWVRERHPSLVMDRGRNFFEAGAAHYDHYKTEISRVLSALRPDLVVGESTLFHELLTIESCGAAGTGTACDLSGCVRFFFVVLWVEFSSGDAYGTGMPGFGSEAQQGLCEMNPSGTLIKTATALLVFALPTGLVRLLLNGMGHCVLPGSRVGFSWLWCDFIGLDRGARIGHMNLIAVRRLLMRESAYFGRLNVAKGPVDVVLKTRAAVGNANRVLRGPAGVSSGPAQLWLGELTKITANHRVDCTQTVHIGAFSVIGGAASQLWTHGYVHEMDGAGRYRIDGRIEIENNVYIGSACLVSMGVRVAKGVIVGGGTSVSRSLTKPGLYVSAPVRALPRPAEPQGRPDMCQLSDPQLVEPVFLKRRP